ncbi:MAG: DUF1957 domain-containing protein [Acidobacteriota bacterium]|nr:DUF1957 domain-containing protein [Acidobacteriota bacterium]
MSERGELAIVLHTHMPYVEGFGTWPFGEEWLWEAMASCYLPLSDLLASPAGAGLTLSLTPVLCDQLEAPDLAERFQRFCAEVRSFTHLEDARGLRAGGHHAAAAELERALGLYRDAGERLRALRGDLLGALLPHARLTSSATHAILPLIASQALLRAQVRGGVQSHLARLCGRPDAVRPPGGGPGAITEVAGGPAHSGWPGGFWLPECAHAPHLDALLADEGVRLTCVELTSQLGAGAREHLRPLRSASGLCLVPIDRATMDLVWSDHGYPSHPHYRDSHRRTIHNHNPWANDGSVYDHARARQAAESHARDFVRRVRLRLQDAAHDLHAGGLAVFAADTELFGHWWHEGPSWLRAVCHECERQGLPLVPLDRARALRDPAKLPAAAAEWPATSWGEHNDLSTWSYPRPTSARAHAGDGGQAGAVGEGVIAVADMAVATRAAELQVLRRRARAGPAALRELLALQASDWAFMTARGVAVPYAQERFGAHLHACLAALRAGPDADSGALRNLAPGADPRVLGEP